MDYVIINISIIVLFRMLIELCTISEYIISSSDGWEVIDGGYGGNAWGFDARLRTLRSWRCWNASMTPALVWCRRSWL